MQLPQLVAAVVAPQGFDAQALRARCVSELGEALTPRTFIAVDRLPHNAGGKIPRAELSAFLRQRPAPIELPRLA